MTVPALVRDRLGDEPVRATVSLGDDDALVVTPTRTLVYRGEGLLSGESVEEYPHDAESVAVSEGRRKSTIGLDHGIDGASELTVPTARLDEALEPLLGGVLSTAGVLEPDESVETVYRSGELTVVIAERRVIKHVGDELWNEEYEEYAYGEVTRLDIEEGDVSSQVIVEVDGRPQRIKAPSDDAREIRERIERTLLAFHEVPSYTEFERRVAEASESDETDETEADDGEAKTGGEESSEGETASDSPEETAAGTATMFEGEEGTPGEGGTVEVAGTEASTGDDDPDVAAELAELREVVERQNELLEAHQQVLEHLVDELRD